MPFTKFRSSLATLSTIVRRKITSIVPREKIRKSIKSGKVMINLIRYELPRDYEI